MKKCYGIIEDGEETLVTIDDGPPFPSITVRSLRDGTDFLPPQRTAGFIEGDHFVYGDGTRLYFDEKELRGPETGLLAGIVMSAVSCRD